MKLPCLPPCTKQFTCLFIILGLLSTNFINAQSKTLYHFQDLSRQAYAKQKDSINKHWECPPLFKAKETQKIYKEIWNSRTTFITKAIDNNDFIREKDIEDYIGNIIEQIVKSNPTLISASPMLLIDRNAAVNAYAIGGNVLAVNLGLISFAQSREEIALVLAHELSHNILQHAENSMKEKAEWLGSDQYKESLNAVLDSKYERFTRLQKIFEGYKFSSSKHNRYHESDADSLAIELLKNSKIGFDARFFLRLDSVDFQYKKPLDKELKTYFSAYNLSFEDAWTQKRSKGLSTRNYNFSESTEMNDSLKTHPDCVVRYNNSLHRTEKNITLTPIPTSIKEKANKISLWNMFNNLHLTASLFRVIQEKDRGNTDEWYDFMFHNIFALLYYSDQQMNRFNAIGIVPKEHISEDYYALQTLLEQIPRDILEDYCRSLQATSFWQKLPADAVAFKSLMFSLNFEDGLSDNNRNKMAKTFMNTHTASMYCEFAGHFNKK